MPREVRAVVAGAGAIVLVIALAIAVRGPVDADALAVQFDLDSNADLPPAVTASASAAAPSSAPTANAPSVSAASAAARASGAEPSGNARVLHADATPGVSAAELRAKLEKDLLVGNHRAAVADIDALVQKDPTAIEDRDLRATVVDLAMRIMVGGGSAADELFDMITQRMGTHGDDILYELVTTRGGSHAAKRAEDLLKSPAIVARGTPAMRVAWELRTSPCDKKAELIERAKVDGDARAFGQLVLLGNDCRRRGGPCCMHDDPRLKEAIASMKARLNLE
jgi:hypothetical protein